jgi:hypothetical protein
MQESSFHFYIFYYWFISVRLKSNYNYSKITIMLYFYFKKFEMIKKIVDIYANRLLKIERCEVKCL